MLLIDPQTGEIIDCNLAAAEFYGYGKETLSSLNIRKINTQPEVKVRLKMENAVKNDKNHFFFTHQLADGTYKDVEVYSSPLKINNRQVLFSIVHDITERRTAEQALKTSEKYYRGLFENAHDAVIIMSPEDETILDVNQRACEIYGFYRDKFIGKSMKSLSKDIQKGEHQIQKTLNQGAYNNFETVHFNNEGNKLNIEINAAVVDYKGQKAILSINRDITARKNAERYIRNINLNLEKEVEKRTEQLDKINNDLVSEIEERKKLERQIIKDKELWRRSFISISEGIYLIDHNYNILECNKAFADILGDVPENLIGKKAYKVIHGKTEPPSHCISCNAINKKKTIKGQFWEPHLRKYIYTTSDPVINEGEIEFSINTLRDITEEKKYEKALKKSEETFRTYIENAPIGIFLTNEKGKFLDANPEGLQLLNYTMDELLNYTIQDIVSKDEQDDVTHFFQSLQDNGNSFQETKLITNKGESVDVFVNAVKLDDDRYLAFVLDISDRKKAEENIYKSLEREKELSEMKTRFISMVSHEFRTPLANIYSNAQLLDRFEEKWNKEKKARSLDRILNSVQVLNSMLDDVSLFGKKQSGKLQYNPTPVDFEGYISSLIDETLTNFNTKRHVRFEKDDNVGTIHTDKFLLHHIVTNLLSNALKYSSEGTEVLLRIDNSDREWINLTIQDHGKGIPEKELNKIFEPFYRASNIDNVSGTGLGMAIIKHCTDLLNGKLHIDSEIGIGTTVSINIPVSAKKPKANVHEA
jgi:PAS domain S-box-containing protein